MDISMDIHIHGKPVTLVWMSMDENGRIFDPMGIPMRIPTYGKSCGSGMGIEIEILYLRQPWTDSPNL